MRMLKKRPSPSELETRERILGAAQRLFARKGYDATTTKDLATTAKVAEGTLFRHFNNKKAILIEVATQGWVEILTDLLMELSEMANYRAIAPLLRKRMGNLRKNGDMMRVCFMEAQFHPELQERIQGEVIDKMTDVAEAFFQTAMDRGVYRKMDSRVVARVFLGMFAIAGFSESTIMSEATSPKDLQLMAEGLADIFLNGVLASSVDMQAS
ncbi:MAG: TetR/AcrR family transcriptional regulator [Cyanobacteria bacterium P01_D01_bin.73]